MALIGISAEKQDNALWDTNWHHLLQARSTPVWLWLHCIDSQFRKSLLQATSAGIALGVQGAPAQLDASFGYSWQTLWAWWWPLAQSSLECAAVRISAGLLTLSQQRFAWSAFSFVNAMMGLAGLGHAKAQQVPSAWPSCALLRTTLFFLTDHNFKTKTLIWRIFYLWPKRFWWWSMTMRIFLIPAQSGHSVGLLCLCPRHLLLHWSITQVPSGFSYLWISLPFIYQLIEKPGLPGLNTHCLWESDTQLWELCCRSLDNRIVKNSLKNRIKMI